MSMVSLKSQTEGFQGDLTTDDSLILIKAFNTITSSQKIVYTDTTISISSNLERFKEIFSYSTVTDKRHGKSITLTKDEQNLILSNIGKQVVWNERLFPNSIRIPKDSIWVVLERLKSDRKVAFNNAKSYRDTVAMKELLGDPYVFTFNKPVYLRNNTLCFLTFTALCGTECGQSEMSFYKKESGEWRKWLVISASEF